MLNVLRALEKLDPEGLRIACEKILNREDAPALSLGIHDLGAGLHLPRGGTLVTSETVELDGTNGAHYDRFERYGLTVIARLNYGYHGKGTIPLPDKYPKFAERVKRFVEGSKGCRIWIIGNEPNLAIERPQNVEITPQMYAECFTLCRNAIKSVRPTHLVLPAAIGPWNTESGDWIEYWKTMLSLIEPDGLALHAYAHNGEPPDDPTKMIDMPSRHYNFRCYRDFLDAVPDFKHLPTYITEANMGAPWPRTLTGWVQKVARELVAANGDCGYNIKACVFYRYDFDQHAVKGNTAFFQDLEFAIEWLKENNLWPC